jgi:carbon-monoxide dehydrogenase large subunit
MMGAKHFGARVQRLEDPALLAGRGRFVDDVKLPGVLHACFVRSSHAHARLRGIDIKPAMGIPGVHTVLTADDLPEPMRTEPMPMLLPNPTITVARTQTVLARDEVHYLGHPVAVVIADTRYIAEDAAALLIVNYDPLDAVGDCRDAIKDGAARAHSDLDSNIVAKFASAYGNIDAAFTDAAHVFDEVIWQHRGGGMALENRAVLASLDPVSDVLTVWSSTQTPHIGRRMLADLLEREIESIRMIAPDVGGGFGPKAIFYPEEAVISAVALKLGRPVKWIEDRYENFLCATQERDQYWNMAIAVDTDGKILGVRGRLLHDSGAFVPWGIIMPYIGAVTVPGPYVIPAYHLETDVVLTNKVPTTPVRGAGRPQAVFAMERLLDRLARELELDRAEVRRRNFIKPEQMPYEVGLLFRDGKPLVYDSGDYPKGQQTALELAGYELFRERQRVALDQGRFIGIGVANYVEGTGLGPFEGVTVRVLPSGRVAVATDAASQGQGTRTTLAQIVAEQVGCRIDQVVMTIGDTGAIAHGVGAFASRQAVNAGCSAVIAGQAVRTQLIALAARAWGERKRY